MEVYSAVQTKCTVYCKGTVWDLFTEMKYSIYEYVFIKV